MGFGGNFTRAPVTKLIDKITCNHPSYGSVGKRELSTEARVNQLSAGSKHGRQCRRAERRTNVNRTNILVAGTEASAGVMAALRTVRKPWDGHEFEFAETVLRNGEAAIRAGLHSMMIRHRPGLLLLCAASDQPAQLDLVLKELQSNHSETPVLLALDAGHKKELPDFARTSVTDFIVAPFRDCDLLPRLRRWCRSSNDESAGRSELKLKLGLGQLIGESPELMAAIRQTPKFAGCDATVLLTGETGTGKEMFARAIHYLSPRAAMPFIPVNCGAIPTELVENELFGHEPGAFTGAAGSMRGLIAEAEGGTLFLDEIDTLPLPTQVKLLRFLQDHAYRPLGARKLCGADIRIIAASNAKLDDAVRAGRFRADLFYRINVLSLALPALRERRSDIPLLARHFAAECAREMKIAPKEISPAAMHKLMAYRWPGNVRELQNVIARAIVLVEDNVIRPMDVELPGQAKLMERKSFKAIKARVVEDFERSYLEQLLAEHDGNITQAARAADKNRRALWELLRKHQIHLPPPDKSSPR